MKRKHIRMEEKLASALYEIELWKSHAHAFNDFETLRALRNANAPASAVCKRFHWDHAVFHVDAGPDTWVNLTPLPIGEHKEKTKKDLGVIAKGKRIRKKQAAHDIKAAKGNAEALGHLSFLELMDTYSRIKRAAKRRAIPSRPFPMGEAAKGNADVLAALTTCLDKAKDGKLNYLAVYGLPKIKRAWPKRPFPKRKTRHK